MASFSVDRNKIVFASQRTGIVTLMFDNFPLNDYQISISGERDYFTLSKVNTDSQVTVATKAVNNDTQSHRMVVRYTNASDSSDYIEIEVIQRGTRKPQSNGVDYPDISDSEGSLGSVLCLGKVIYIPADKMGGAEVLVDSTTECSFNIVSDQQNWLNCVNATPHITDTGFLAYNVTYIKNYDRSSRRGTVSFIDANSNTVDLLVYQEGNTPSENTVFGNRRSIGGCLCIGTNIEIHYPSGGTVPDKYEIINPDGSGNFYDWVTVSKRTSSKYVSASIDAGTDYFNCRNSSPHTRAIIVEFRTTTNSNSYVTSVLIVQKGWPNWFEVTPDHSININNESRTYEAYSFAISDSPVTGVITSGSDWLSDLNFTSNSIGSHTYYDIVLTIASNSTGVDRTGDIQVTNGTDTITVSVVQSSLLNGAIPSELFFDNYGGDKDLTVLTNSVRLLTNISAHNYPSWLIETRYQNGAKFEKYIYTAESNTSSSRTGNIVFADTSGNQVIIPITQGESSSESISVSPSSLSFGADASYADISLTYGGTYYNTDAAEVHTWVTVNISDTETGKASGTVAVASNTSTESRSGNVYFSDELGASIALPIEQAGISFALSANPSTLNIPASGGSVTTAVTYEGTLSAASLPSWLSETHTDNDANHRTYTVTAASNGPTQERTFNWKLNDDYNNMYVFISQAAAEVPSMVISPTSSSVGGSSGTVDITVRSTNISDISYSISDSWITYSSKSGSVYTFSYEANNTASVREGSITFSGGGISKTFTLTQECISTDSITVNKNVLSVVNGGGYFRDFLTVTYTGKVTVQSSLFITGVSSFSSTGTYNYSFSVSSNTETETSNLREGNIKFIGDNGTSCEVVVYQGGKPYNKRPVCIPDYKLDTYPAEGGQKYLAIDYYKRLTYTGVPSWITLNIVAGGTGETDSIDDISPVVFSVVALRNNSSSSRNGTMVFQGGDSLTLKTSKIAVSQEGKGGSNPLSVSPTELSFTVSGETKSVTVSGGTGTIAVNTGSFPSWLSIASAGNGVYNITASENSGSSRSFDVWFTDEAFNTVIVNVSQESSSVELTVSPSSKRFGSEGGSQVFRVTYNTRINYNTLPSWLSIVSGTTTGSTIEYTMTASENTDTSSRNFNWVLTDELTSVAVPISQSGASGPGPEPVEEGSLKVYPEKLRYYSDGGRILVSFTNRPEAGIGYSITYTDGSGWLSVEGVSPNMYVSATANDGIRRRAEIKFYDLSDNTNYVIVPVIQGSVEGYTSIWMDDLYYPENRDASGNYFYKVVNQDTDQIYFIGISSKPLSWTGNIGGIDIPRLVDNYIKSDFVQQNTGEDWVDMNSGYCTVDVYNMAETNAVVDATFKYWNDWSRFEKKYDYTRSLNDPINGKGCDNMIIPFCVYYDDEATFTIVDTDKNGNINTYTLSSPSSPFMMRYNSYYDIKKLEYKQDNEVLFSYDMNHCGPGAFIYRNRFGGWDSFLIEGNISKTDNYTKQNYRIKGEYNQEYVINTLKYIDEKRTDSIDIDTTYEASTGWLTDEESERLVFHLLSSPIVYFQNLHKENQLYDTDSSFDIIPVRITASSSEYKKFRNGRRLVNYLITFEKCNIEKVRQ